jgi:hypothetical protein
MSIKHLLQPQDKHNLSDWHKVAEPCSVIPAHQCATFCRMFLWLGVRCGMGKQNFGEEVYWED